MLSHSIRIKEHMYTWRNCPTLLTIAKGHRTLDTIIESPVDICTRNCPNGCYHNWYNSRYYYWYHKWDHNRSCLSFPFLSQFISPNFYLSFYPLALSPPPKSVSQSALSESVFIQYLMRLIFREITHQRYVL